MSLSETLESYSKSNMYPFHMPGHKRMLDGCYAIDMTEVENMDDLHDPSGVLLEEQKRLARIYGADESFILVGGSTVGNLASIYGCLSEGDFILIQRNSHKSVYNAAILRHLRVGYIYTSCDENGIYQAVTLQQIKDAIEQTDDKEKPKAIVITSPTYEGYICNIKEISDFCHSQDIILIVDSAHGAHLGFHENLTGQATCYADVTIMSLHKTLPSLTQTAALHVTGDRVDARRIREALDIFETSSPSYVLMNSVSECLSILESQRDLFDKYVENLEEFYTDCGKLRHLQLLSLEPTTKDLGKLVIITGHTNISGIELARILREKYEIETELSSFYYVLAMTSIMDTKEGFDRLKEALIEIDGGLSDKKIELQIKFSDIIKDNKLMEPWEAKAKAGKEVDYKKAEGEICQDSICMYPPGTPLIVAGERVSKDIIDMISLAKESGIHVTGLKGDLMLIVN